MIRSLVSGRYSTSQSCAPRRNLKLKDLEKAIEKECLIWIDIVDPDTDELTWLAAQFDLSPAVVEDLNRNDRRPTLLVYPDYLFVSLFEPYVSLARVAGREIHCIITDTCFITVRGTDTVSVDAAYNRMSQSDEVWQSGVTYCFYLTAQHVTDTYYPLLDRISEHLSRMEEDLLDVDSGQRSGSSIYAIKQQLINLRQMVSPQREVFSSIIGEKRLSNDNGTIDLFRHLYERLLRVYDVIDSQRDLSSNVLDMMQNQESRRLVEVVNRLTIFSMVFLPLTFLTGLFELNFTTTSDPFVLPVNGNILFVLIISAMILSSSVMTYVFKRQEWL